MSDVLNQISIFVSQNAVQLGIAFAAALVLVANILIIVLIRRKPEDIITKIQENFSELQARQERLEPVIKDEITRNRQETARSAQQARQELSVSLKSSSDHVV